MNIEEESSSIQQRQQLKRKQGREHQISELLQTCPVRARPVSLLRASRCWGPGAGLLFRST